MLSPNNAIPLYQQLKDELREKIKTGALKPDERIPSERELCEQYHVSRMTVRQALAELANEGLLYRTHGKGTFVARPRIDQELVRVTPFESTLRSKGLRPATKILGHKMVSADYEVATALAIPLLSPLVNLTLLGLGNEQPVAYYSAYFPENIGHKMAAAAQARLARKAPFTTYDLYDDLPEVHPVRLTQSFEALSAGADLAETLQIPPEKPLMHITTVVYLDDGRPVEYRHSYYRGDMYRFHITRPAR
ncbi:MAG: GntR family transcriptional regulator [Bacillota bacterium]